MALLRPWELEDKRSFGERRGGPRVEFNLCGFQRYMRSFHESRNKQNEIIAYSATVGTKGI